MAGLLLHRCATSTTILVTNKATLYESGAMMVLERNGALMLSNSDLDASSCVSRELS